MNQLTLLSAFFDRIRQDARIGPSHISIYCALVKLAIDQNTLIVQCKNKEVMKSAKVEGHTVFHTRIRELDEYGYLKYSPSFYHATKNRYGLL